MKKLHLQETNRSLLWQSGMIGVRKLATCAAIVLVGMLTSCSDDDVKNDNDEPIVAGENTSSLSLLSGTAQKGRVQCITKTRAYTKKERLAYVGKILPLEDRKDLLWSATAVAFNEDGTKAYISWHSDKQANKPATVWGGAVDVVDLAGEKLEIKTTASSDLLKFNHVMYDNNTLFLASTSAKDAGVVSRIKLTNGDIVEGTADCIGFPGVSVNAVAKAEDGNMIAVSGYTGTYGTFAADVTAQPFYYGDKEQGKDGRTNVVETFQDNTENFGGKYVTTDENGTTYVLYDTDSKGAKITEVKKENAKTVALGVALTSADKVAETYDYLTGEWILSSEAHNYYGKHVFAVKNGIAYVACGDNGLLVYDLNNNTALYTENIRTTGLCVDDEFIYAATENGLQVYDLELLTVNGTPQLHRYAFEVAAYDEVSGEPVSKEPAITGTAERHSPNFVAVNPVTKEIYVAYGQSGVRVYKFRADETTSDVTE